AIGKAAYVMAKVAEDVLKDRITEGLIITKYGHAKGPVDRFEIIEAGHPLPDENSFLAADRAMKLVQGLSGEDHVLVLLSGGASSLFEKPVLPADDYIKVMDGLLKSGADITELNTVRKHLSFVKGGRFAALAAPAHVDTVILSDVVGNDLSFVGSGPTYPDSTTGEQAFSIREKYKIGVRGDTIEMLMNDTPKVLNNVSFYRIGDVGMLCNAAKNAAEALGYQTVLLTDSLGCEAREAGAFIASIARTFRNTLSKIAFIIGGETVVHVKGDGLGGRNQEMALAAAEGITGLYNVCFFSVGSDGTDGPTDAAGGIVDGDTKRALRKAGFDIYKTLENNDAYHALEAVGSLVMTGPTGTNVNDLSVLLIDRA
ncbi:MAG: glycerate kinase, partial [Lachnospiraceae bacterium]|nr:glycerate kinase [Lachnospiraceae bacterium]